MTHPTNPPAGTRPGSYRWSLPHPTPHPTCRDVRHDTTWEQVADICGGEPEWKEVRGSRGGRQLSRRQLSRLLACGPELAAKGLSLPQPLLPGHWLSSPHLVSLVSLPVLCPLDWRTASLRGSVATAPTGRHVEPPHHSPPTPDSHPQSCPYSPHPTAPVPTRPHPRPPPIHACPNLPQRPQPSPCMQLDDEAQRKQLFDEHIARLAAKEAERAERKRRCAPASCRAMISWAVPPMTGFGEVGGWWLKLLLLLS